jgi:hypothetical protein
VSSQYVNRWRDGIARYQTRKAQLAAIRSEQAERRRYGKERGHADKLARLEEEKTVPSRPAIPDEVGRIRIAPPCCRESTADDGLCVQHRLIRRAEQRDKSRAAGRLLKGQAAVRGSRGTGRGRGGDAA